MRGEDCIARCSANRGGGAFLGEDRVAGGGVAGGGGAVLLGEGRVAGGAVAGGGGDPGSVDDLRTAGGEIAWALPPGEIL